MGSLNPFASTKKPTADPSVAAAIAKQKALALEQEKKVEDEALARRRGLRGVRSLLSGGFLGFDDDSTTLGAG